jgi:peroxiredoxin Q/BCP
MLEIGSRLPDMRITYHDGSEADFKELLGKTTVVYFYPMDNTPGCTKEACSFRDNITRFKGINVVGVSTQGVDSHKSFIEKFNLNFPLIADKDKKISKYFGVLKPTGIASRVTFIFDKEGILRFVYDKVDPEGHAEEVLDKIRELGLG